MQHAAQVVAVHPDQPGLPARPGGLARRRKAPGNGQRRHQLSSSVTSELQNFLVGLNVFDRDIARAADLLGFSAKEADRLRKLAPGEFFAMGPALSPLPLLAKVDPTITEHLGATPTLRGAADVAAPEAERLLDLAALREVQPGARDPSLTMKGVRALDAFLLEPAAPTATAIVGALKRIAPNATTAAALTDHLGVDREAPGGARPAPARLRRGSRDRRHRPGSRPRPRRRRRQDRDTRPAPQLGEAVDRARGRGARPPLWRGRNRDARRHLRPIVQRGLRPRRCAGTYRRRGAGLDALGGRPAMRRVRARRPAAPARRAHRSTVQRPRVARRRARDRPREPSTGLVDRRGRARP